ncbi:hypothetical protein A3J90_02200 [candidate division WOR-1 bacterium RIFOXYC2_FULL_37_10]|uniref:DUF218 domain-containing protein n=1 Tax=candidate division WOR-1 bacterium RIFOXYB2_FULL_37_13 TaxID=1802579 RepID=A0A1F4SNY4_UNCSA|nr:MAG: hypothetical protein A2310_04900 [candidate division WOR-1 bacterium RIFOXYB2_FULL_37_13]OGC37067.1 MAG: hypothetical protein A3J90_02200 [candidate division WOR-1 bacterium RIFOXYC2_FULL_37_10]
MLKKLFICFVVFIILFVFFYSFIFQGMASFLKVQDKLEKADIVLTLAGDSNGERVAQAVVLYKQGYAPKILMSGGPAVWNLTYAQNMRRQATSLGVPSKDVILQDRSKSTLEDIKFSLPILKKLSAKKLILVTSPTHIRRATLVARKYYGREGIKVIAYPVQESDFNPDRWWTRHEDLQLVVWEYISLAGYLLKGELF